MLDAELQAAAAAWQLAGRVGWWVELVAVRGSAPRGVGAALLVDAAEVLGSIGGGHLEWQALRLAREGRLASTASRSAPAWANAAAAAYACASGRSPTGSPRRPQA
jgi:xanthine dehydrogenase accessory factor